MQPVATAAIHQRELTTHITAAHSAMSTVALHLARRATQPPCAQLRSMAPKSGWYQSHACRRGELRAAAQAARRMKTVVGSPGTKMPKTPSKRQSTAKASSSQRTGAGRGRRTGGGGGMGAVGSCVAMADKALRGKHSLNGRLCMDGQWRYRCVDSFDLLQRNSAM